MPKAHTIAAYYFPNYHADARNHEVHGLGWTEWDVVRNAVPRYPGHYQPRVPAWGYEDESDPAVMARKIQAAADSGIDVFLYDWYWHDGGPFLQAGLERGFLEAEGNHRLRFAIHWANHDWLSLHPGAHYESTHHLHRLLYPGAITPATFEVMTDHIVKRYFSHASYWTIDGAPYFSIYDLSKLIEGFGSVEAAARALESFRAKTRAAGFRDLHLNQVLWNFGILPGESVARSPGALLHELGFTSYTSYVWIHHVLMPQFPETDYLWVFERYLEYWDRTTGQIDLPYFPNVTMGWDSSPRTVQSDSFENVGYPFTPVLSGNTPARFEQALRATKDRLRRNGGDPILTINAWNEWTEGSYLEPDELHGTGYLDAIERVFGA